MERNWERALYNATKGRRLGAIICCAFGWQRKATPRFEGKAVITSDGFAMCNFYTSDGSYHQGAFAGSMDDIIRNVRGVADHCTLDPQERAAFYAKMREWFADDYRARPEWF